MRGVKVVERIRRRVLIVDDEEINRQILGMILGNDYEISYAADGQKALDMIREAGGSGRAFSIILLDLLMPVMTGQELLAALKDEKGFQTPVIVMTADKTAEVESLELGAVDYIKKPYDVPEIIRARIKRSIELFEEKQIIEATELDELTGLFTRGYFFEYARKLYQAGPGKTFDAVVLNINHFRLINEMFSREFGDGVLRTVADEIRLFLGGDDGIACRSEADMFYLYCTHKDDYLVLKERICQKLAGVFNASHNRIRIGVCGRMEDLSVDTAEQIERQVDRARDACNSLRDNFNEPIAYYDTRMHEEELLGEYLINDLDRALGDNQFRIFYQPKYNIQGDKPVLTSAEALVRWKHPERGWIQPSLFVPLFEKSGLIKKIDHYVWHEAARQIRTWRETVGRSVPVSVNVSRVDLYEPDIEDILVKIRDDYGLETGDYLLEITEFACAKDSDLIIKTIEDLRNQGFHIELDDFGTGYSSLTMLSEMPIDVLKLDRQFIVNLSQDNRRPLELVQLIIGIARYLDVPVVAEGVETDEQARLLKEAGCDIIQGYYFSKPLPPDEFAALIERSGAAT